jgi:hypothetical protein
MLIDGTFVLIGPFLYGSFYLIAYVSLWLQRLSNIDNLQLGEL